MMTKSHFQQTSEQISYHGKSLGRIVQDDVRTGKAYFVADSLETLTQLLTVPSDETIETENHGEMPYARFHQEYLASMTGFYPLQEPPTQITIVNVVATGSLGKDIDIPRLAAKLESIEYNPRCFPGLIFRLREPKTSFLLFPSGKMVCTGTKSEEQARLAFDIMTAYLKRMTK
jgi:hypothetical protein